MKSRPSSTDTKQPFVQTCLVVALLLTISTDQARAYTIDGRNHSSTNELELLKDKKPPKVKTAKDYLQQPARNGFGALSTVSLKNTHKSRAIRCKYTVTDRLGRLIKRGEATMFPDDSKVIHHIPNSTLILSLSVESAYFVSDE